MLENSDLKNLIAENITFLLSQNKIDIEYLSKKIDVDLDFLKLCLNGQRRLGLKAIIKTADFFRVQVDDIVKTKEYFYRQQRELDLDKLFLLLKELDKNNVFIIKSLTEILFEHENTICKIT